VSVARIMLTILAALLALSNFGRAETAAVRPVPIVYCTDLLHPHSDPDDHFDLAMLFAMREFEVKAIMLDRGEAQKKRTGRIPLEQMFYLTGREVPYATGLSKKLERPDDKGLEQPKNDQAAVELLLATLRQSPEPMILFLTGSARDTCAAFNRNPDLFRQKVSRLYLNMGSLRRQRTEWNVRLDPQAYIGLMQSGLPIYWCPCQPMKQNRTTHWTFDHKEVLEGINPKLLNFFIYALQRCSPDELDPMKAITMDLRPWRHLVMAMTRHMWCVSPLFHAAGRSIYQVGDQWVATVSAPQGSSKADIFTFVPVRTTTKEIEGKVVTEWTEETSNPNMHVYKVTDTKNHEPALKSCLRDLLHHFPMAQ